MKPLSSEDDAGFSRGEWLDVLLICLAFLYLIYVGLGGVGAEWYSSADGVGDGKVWLLFTSALDVVVELDEAQLALLAVTVAFVIFRVGPRVWWAVAIGGHVFSAILAYTGIGIAVALGSSSADTSAGQTDYGVSVILAASLGALAASGLTAIQRNRDLGQPSSRADRAALILGLLGLLGMIAFSFGWYDSQHLIGYIIGFFLTRYLMKRPAFRWAGPGAFLRSGSNRPG